MDLIKKLEHVDTNESYAACTITYLVSNDTKMRNKRFLIINRVRKKNP
jgi:hypothetical protein